MQTQKSENEEESQDSVRVLEDNPCWGTPARHRLQDLLSIIDRDSSIAFDSPQYLVLNKPPDLRMDGPYPATVFKLLTYWYPPPSLQQQSTTTPDSNSKPATATEIGDARKNATIDSKDNCDLALLEAISGLHQHNDVSDNFLRPCHQLDYATSGVLLVAKTQEAAAHIGRLFEERHEGVQKSYVAIVVGDLCLKNSSSNNNNGSSSNQNDEQDLRGKNGNTKVPVWKGGSTTSQLRERMRLLEGSYRRTRVAAGKQHRRVRDNAARNKKKNERISSFAGGTFHGFQPAHSIFLKWKANLKKERDQMTASTGDNDSKDDARNESSSPQKKRQKRQKCNSNLSASALLTNEDWERIWDPVTAVVGATTALSSEEATNFQNTNWKELKKEHPALKQAMIKATDFHNNILREAVRKVEQNELEQNDNSTEEGSNGSGEELPTVFRLSNAGNTTEKDVNDRQGPDGSDTGENTFYICCPLAQHPDRFNMVVPSSMAKNYPHLPTPGGTDDESTQLRFRPSLTKCTILERGTLSTEEGGADASIRVTKVRLFPITGRRHQLRVHMALAGFPILGDVAYGGDRVAGNAKENENENDEAKNGEEQEITRDICSRMCLHAHSLELPTLLGEDKPGWKVVTPDPFVFGATGKLEL